MKKKMTTNTRARTRRKMSTRAWLVLEELDKDESEDEDEEKDEEEDEDKDEDEDEDKDQAKVEDEDDKEGKDEMGGVHPSVAGHS